jgi:hypothetical protein
MARPAEVCYLVCCHVSCGCWGGSATACHVACWWGSHVRSVWWWGPPGWGGPMVDCHVALTCWGGSFVCCHLACPLLVWTTHRWACSTSGDVAQSDLAICICLAKWLLMWTIGWLPRGISGTHLSDMWDPHGWGGPMRCWHVALTYWGGPMRCWHVSHSLSSLILCVYVWDPQFAPRCVSVPNLHPDEPLIESEPLIFLFNLFYLSWIYFNSSTYPKIMKISPKIPKFMMIIS